MGSNIHQQILTRLMLGWLILSLVIGGVVYYLEMEKVDNHVLDLATREAGTFTSENLRHFNLVDESHPDVLRQIQAKADEVSRKITSP